MPNRMDSMLSHGMGKLKAVKARLSGLVGVFEVLAEQHGEVTALLERARMNDDKLTELWPTIRRELLSHEKAELNEVYSFLRMQPELRAMAEHHDSEAGELEHLVHQIDDMAIGTDARRNVLERLVDRVLHHAREEEREIFPRAQKVIGKAQAESLADTFLMAKQQLADVV